jgi:hypothetical protein
MAGDYGGMLGKEAEEEKVEGKKRNEAVLAVGGG